LIRQTYRIKSEQHINKVNSMEHMQDYLHYTIGIINNKDQCSGVYWSFMSGEVALQFAHCV
jgi:hypothetical protein